MPPVARPVSQPLQFDSAAARCPRCADRRTRRSHLSSPSLLQVGSCRSTDAVVFIPPLCVGVHRAAHGEQVTLPGTREKNRQLLRHQANPDKLRTNFFLCVCGAFLPPPTEARFPSGNGSPEVLFRAVRRFLREPRRLLRSRAADASNGERLKSARRNPTSSSRYLTVAKVVY